MFTKCIGSTGSYAQQDFHRQLSIDWLYCRTSQAGIQVKHNFYYRTEQLPFSMLPYCSTLLFFHSSVKIVWGVCLYRASLSRAFSFFPHQEPRAAPKWFELKYISPILLNLSGIVDFNEFVETDKVSPSLSSFSVRSVASQISCCFLMKEFYGIPSHTFWFFSRVTYSSKHTLVSVSKPKASKSLAIFLKKPPIGLTSKLFYF